MLNPTVALVFLLPFVVVALSTDVNLCLDHEGVLANPEDCSSFLICSNGTSSVVNCSSGLLFNILKRSCDYNSSVDCSLDTLYNVGTSTPIDEEANESRVESVILDEVECETDTCTCVYPSKASCSDYWRCENGIPYKETCPAGLLMNPKKLTCDYADNVECEIPITPIPGSSSITTSTKNNETVKDETVTDVTRTDETVADETVANETVTGEMTTEETVADDKVTDETVTDETVTDETVTDETVTDVTVTYLTIADESVTDGTATDGTATDGTATDGTATDGTATDGTATDGKVTDETVTDETTEEFPTFEIDLYNMTVTTVKETTSEYGVSESTSEEATTPKSSEISLQSTKITPEETPTSKTSAESSAYTLDETSSFEIGSQNHTNSEEITIELDSETTDSVSQDTITSEMYFQSTTMTPEETVTSSTDSESGAYIFEETSTSEIDSQNLTTSSEITLEMDSEASESASEEITTSETYYQSTATIAEEIATSKSDAEKSTYIVEEITTSGIDTQTIATTPEKKNSSEIDTHNSFTTEEKTFEMNSEDSGSASEEATTSEMYFQSTATTLEETATSKTDSEIDANSLEEIISSEIDSYNNSTTEEETLEMDSETSKSEGTTTEMFFQSTSIIPKETTTSKTGDNNSASYTVEEISTDEIDSESIATTPKEIIISEINSPTTTIAERTFKMDTSELDSEEVTTSEIYFQSDATTPKETVTSKTDTESITYSLEETTTSEIVSYSPTTSTEITFEMESDTSESVLEKATTTEVDSQSVSATLEETMSSKIDSYNISTTEKITIEADFNTSLTTLNESTIFEINSSSNTVTSTETPTVGMDYLNSTNLLEETTSSGIDSKYTAEIDSNSFYSTDFFGSTTLQNSKDITTSEYINESNPSTTSLTTEVMLEETSFRLEHTTNDEDIIDGESTSELSTDQSLYSILPSSTIPIEVTEKSTQNSTYNHQQEFTTNSEITLVDRTTFEASTLQPLNSSPLWSTIVEKSTEDSLAETESDDSELEFITDNVSNDEKKTTLLISTVSSRDTNSLPSTLMTATEEIHSGTPTYNPEHLSSSTTETDTTVSINTGSENPGATTDRNINPNSPLPPVDATYSTTIAPVKEKISTTVSDATSYESLNEEVITDGFLNETNSETNDESGTQKNYYTSSINENSLLTTAYNEVSDDTSISEGFDPSTVFDIQNSSDSFETNFSTLEGGKEMLSTATVSTTIVSESQFSSTFPSQIDEITYKESISVAETTYSPQTFTNEQILTTNVYESTMAEKINEPSSAQYPESGTSVENISTETQTSTDDYSNKLSTTNTKYLSSSTMQSETSKESQYHEITTAISTTDLTFNVTETNKKSESLSTSYETNETNNTLTEELQTTNDQDSFEVTHSTITNEKTTTYSIKDLTNSGESTTESNILTTSALDKELTSTFVSAELNSSLSEETGFSFADDEQNSTIYDLSSNVNTQEKYTDLTSSESIENLSTLSNNTPDPTEILKSTISDISSEITLEETTVSLDKLTGEFVSSNTTVLSNTDFHNETSELLSTNEYIMSTTTEDVPNSNFSPENSVSTVLPTNPSYNFTGMEQDSSSNLPYDDELDSKTFSNAIFITEISETSKFSDKIHDSEPSTISDITDSELSFSEDITKLTSELKPSTLAQVSNITTSKPPLDAFTTDTDLHNLLTTVNNLSSFTEVSVDITEDIITEPESSTIMNATPNFRSSTLRDVTESESSISEDVTKLTNESDSTSLLIDINTTFYPSSLNLFSTNFEMHNSTPDNSTFIDSTTGVFDSTSDVASTYEIGKTEIKELTKPFEPTTDSSTNLTVMDETPNFSPMLDLTSESFSTLASTQDDTSILMVSSIGVSELDENDLSSTLVEDFLTNTDLYINPSTSDAPFPMQNHTETITNSMPNEITMESLTPTSDPTLNDTATIFISSRPPNSSIYTTSSNTENIEPVTSSTSVKELTNVTSDDDKELITDLTKTSFEQYTLPNTTLKLEVTTTFNSTSFSISTNGSDSTDMTSKSALSFSTDSFSTSDEPIERISTTQAFNTDDSVSIDRNTTSYSTTDTKNHVFTTLFEESTSTVADISEGELLLSTDTTLISSSASDVPIEHTSMPDPFTTDEPIDPDTTSDSNTSAKTQDFTSLFESSTSTTAAGTDNSEFITNTSLLPDTFSTIAVQENKTNEVILHLSTETIISEIINEASKEPTSGYTEYTSEHLTSVENSLSTEGLDYFSTETINDELIEETASSNADVDGTDFTSQPFSEFFSTTEMHTETDLLYTNGSTANKPLYSTTDISPRESKAYFTASTLKPETETESSTESFSEVYTNIQTESTLSLQTKQYEISTISENTGETRSFVTETNEDKKHTDSTFLFSTNDLTTSNLTTQTIVFNSTTTNNMEETNPSILSETSTIKYIMSTNPLVTVQPVEKTTIVSNDEQEPDIINISRITTNNIDDAFLSTENDITTRNLFENTSVNFQTEYIVSSSETNTDDTTLLTTDNGILHSTIAASVVCMTQNGLFPNPDDCKTFYQCKNGKPTLSECIENEHFNPFEFICQHPCLAKCDLNLDCYYSTGVPSEVTTLNDTSSTFSTQPSLTDGITAEILTTTMEIQTSNLFTDSANSTLTTEIQTSSSLLTEVGSDSYTVDYISSSTPALSTTLTSTTSVCDDGDASPFVGDCRRYYVCINGTSHEMACSNGLHFSPVNMICEEACIAHCDPTLDCSTTVKPLLSTSYSLTICQQRDIVSIPDQCELFVDCTKDNPRESKCPQGLIFNPSSRVCDYPINAGCGKPPTLSISNDPSYQCPCETCLLPSPENCSTYYFCRNGTAYQMKCSRGLLFDKTTNTCNFDDQVVCDTTSSSSTTLAPTTQASGSCPEANGMFRNPSSCRSFIHCSNRTPFLKQCPGNLHFSVKTQRCEFPCDAKCDPTLTCATKPPPTQPMDALCSCRNCKLPNHESCVKYIECRNGKPIHKECSRGQIFDKRRQMCDWAYRVDCRESDICPRRNGIFAFKNDCHKFVHCSNGIPYIMACPAGLVFNSAVVRCVWSYTGSCGTSLGFDQTEPVPGVNRWKCPSSFGLFRHDEDCSKFYQCNSGSAVLKQCPNMLVFNSRYQTCDKRGNVKCDKDLSHQKRSCRRYDHDIRCALNRTHLVHPHCDMYYECMSGKACPKRCPEGLFFNERIAMCDLPANVDCRKSDGSLYSLKKFVDNCQTSDSHMQDPANESCYYKCHRSRIIRGCCGKNRLFDERRGQCQWRHHY